MTLRSAMTAYIIGGKDYRISGSIKLAEQYMPMRNHIVTLIRKIPPPIWQLDMARWVNKRMIFCTTDFKDFSPRKGFRCEAYLKQYSIETDNAKESK